MSDVHFNMSASYKNIIDDTDMSKHTDNPGKTRTNTNSGRYALSTHPGYGTYDI